MKKHHYVHDREAKIQSTKKTMLWMVLIIIIFLLVIARFAISASEDDSGTSLPTGDDAFEIAKDYIRPTIRWSDVQFVDGDYQYTKASDSVFVVKSYFESKENGEQTVKTNFTVRLRYNGGAHRDEENWSLITMDKN